MNDSTQDPKSDNSNLTRRKFIQNTAVGAAGMMIVPRHVLGRGMTPPSDLLNIGGVGIGGMGRANLIALASQNVTALCDVDWDYAGKAFERLGPEIQRMQASINEQAGKPQSQTLTGLDTTTPEQRLANMKRLYTEHWPKAKRYKDYREMFEKQKDIDAVVVATSDHMHTPIALAAMELGKHVYVQKPLTWSVAEARALAKKAKETKIATQMGNQGHSSDEARLAVEYIQSGAIGEVREVHVWTNRPLGFWPQGIPRPEALTVPADSLKWNGDGVDKRLAASFAGNYPVPDTLSWDLFLGVGPKVTYHPIYHPFNWRGWVDWGCGPIGDMGAHLLDVSLWALKLGLPTMIETVCTPFNKVSFPNATQTFFKFPARGKMPAVNLTWYDGGLLPPKPEELGENEAVNKDGGVMIVGSKGKLMHDTYGLNPRILPKSLADATPKPAQTLPRIKTSHELNWVEAAKAGKAASCPFEYAAQLTEIMLLGVVALRAGRKIEYDPASMKVTNVPEANQYLQREYRTGW